MNLFNTNLLSCSAVVIWLHLESIISLFTQYACMHFYYYHQNIENTIAAVATTSNSIKELKKHP